MRIFFRCFKERNLNLLAIVFLCLSMGFGFFIEFFFKEIPCSLCFLQRVCMMGIAFSLYLNILFGVKSKYYGFSLIWALLGMACSLRHIALNICKPVPPQAFLFGSYRLYTWSFITFFLSILGVALLLCIDKKNSLLLFQSKKDKVLYMAVGLLLLMLSIGFFSVLQKQGLAF